MLGLSLSLTRAGVPMRRIVSPPSGFDWTPPLTVYKRGNTFSTSFNAADWKVAATADVWVSPTGSDTTGTGTQAAPYRSIKKGLQAAAALADASVNLYIQAGIYNRNQHWNVTACDKNLNVIAVGGAVVSSCRYEALTWTLDTTGTYKATRSSVATVWDETYPDGDGTPGKLVKKTTLADCEATAGSWYTDGTTLYVHAQDGRQPDTALLVIANIGNASFAYNKQWYLEGIEFEGANVAPFSTTSSGIGANAKLIFNGCKFRFGATATGNGMSITGTPLALSYACSSYANESDGFNYHVGTNGQTYAIEVGCMAYNNGQADGSNNDNGSTSHDSCRVVRVSGSYRTTYGPIVADVDTSASWNLGCSAVNSLAGSTDSQDACWQAGGTASQWLDTCTASGSQYATYTTGAIYTHNCTLTGATFGSVTAY